MDCQTWEALEMGFPNNYNNMKNEITLNDYQARAMETRLESCNNLSYMAFGIVEEVGELNGKLAKAVRKELIAINQNRIGAGYNFALGASEELNDNLKKELGDILWFVAGLADQLGWTLEDVAKTNLKKLAERKAKNDIINHTDH